MRLRWDDGSHVCYKPAKVGQCPGDEACQCEANWGHIYVDGAVSHIIGTITLSLLERDCIELERNIIKGFSSPHGVELCFPQVKAVDGVGY